MREWMDERIMNVDTSCVCVYKCT